MLFFRFLNYQLYLSYFLVSAVIRLVFNPTTELVTPKGIPTKEGKAEMQMHSLFV